MTEISKFERYREIAENPLAVFGQIKNNNLTSESIETLQALYPKYYEEMKHKLLVAGNDVLQKKGTIPYSLKVSMSHFLGAPIDESLMSQNILSNQAVFSLATSSQPQQTKPSKTGMGKMTLAKRTSVQQRNDD